MADVEKEGGKGGRKEREAEEKEGRRGGGHTRDNGSTRTSIV